MNKSIPVYILSTNTRTNSAISCVWMILKLATSWKKKKSAFWNFLPSPIPHPSQASLCLREFPIIQSCLAPLSSPAPPLRAARLYSSRKHHSPCAVWDFEWSVLRHYNAVTLSGHQSDLSLPFSKRASSPGFPFPRSLTLSLLELFKTLHGPTLPYTCHHMQLPQTRLFFKACSETHYFLDLESLFPTSLFCAFKLERSPKP